jgi:ZIP family zinc transporter
MTMQVVLILCLMVLPWVATFTGSMVALKIKMGTQRRQGALLGFAAGVMLASSVWSLIIPAFDEGGHDLRGAALVTLGFVLGCLGMLLLDKIMPHQHMSQDTPEGRPSHLSRPMLLVIAVALHNIPEGLALGIVLSAALQPGGMSPMLGLVFGLGLALQNFPEGMAVVLPMRQAGIAHKKMRDFGTLASFAEPAAAMVGFFGAQLLSTLGGVVMPMMLSVAAGAMVFIVVEELVPESQSGDGGHAPTYGFLLGFWVMAVMGILGG